MQYLSHRGGRLTLWDTPPPPPSKIRHLKSFSYIFYCTTGVLSFQWVATIYIIISLLHRTCNSNQFPSSLTTEPGINPQIKTAIFAYNNYISNDLNTTLLHFILEQIRLFFSTDEYFINVNLCGGTVWNTEHGKTKKINDCFVENALFWLCNYFLKSTLKKYM